MTISRGKSEKHVFTPGNCRTGRKVTHRSKVFRNATFTLGKPPPIGVALQRHPGALDGCQHLIRQVLASPGERIGASVW